jgi:hypothetical protein
MDWIDSSAPHIRARITGLVYLLYFVTAVGSALIPPQIGGPVPLPTNADAFANSVTANTSSYELGAAISLLSTVLYVALGGLLYLLLKPVSRTIALLMLIFTVVESVITAVGGVLQLAPLAVLDGSQYLSVFDAKQLHAIALLLLHISAQSGSVALVFAGVFELLLGYLIYKSGFLPRLIGALVALAGLGWLTFLYAPLSSLLLTEVEVVGFVAELALMLWLLIRGVDDHRWLERSRAA